MPDFHCKQSETVIRQQNTVGIEGIINLKFNIVVTHTCDSIVKFTVLKSVHYPFNRNLRIKRFNCD
jgi:hypothetical protein